MSEQLWRCVECGKWSHAKRRPVAHQRFVKSSEPTPPEEKIISVVMDEQIAVDRFKDGGWFVSCGPFEEWIVSPQRKKPPV